MLILAPVVVMAQALPAFNDEQEAAPEAAETWWNSWFALPEFASQLAHRESSATTTYLGGVGTYDLESIGLDVATSFITPVSWSEYAMLSVAPSFGVQTLRGADGFELPNELYQGSLSLTFIKPLSKEKQLLLGVAPTIATDFEQGSGDAFRMVAFASMMWQRTPTTKWTLGVAATGRDDIPVLPLVGLIWTPSEEWTIDLTLPGPRISHRLGRLPGWETENWIYLAGRFGGGTWAVDRAGVDDQLTSRDFRLVGGWETKGAGCIKPRVEVGYVFGRKLEYESDGASFDPSDTFLVSGGVTY